MQAGTCTCRISVANFIGGFSPSVLCSSSSPISWRSRLIFSSVRDCRAEKGGRAGSQKQSDKIHCFYSQTTSYVEKNPFFSLPKRAGWNPSALLLWLTGRSHTERWHVPALCPSDSPCFMDSAQAPFAPPSTRGDSGAGRNSTAHSKQKPKQPPSVPPVPGRQQGLCLPVLRQNRECFWGHR